MAEAAGASEAMSELECGICCMPYDCCERAPRQLGSTRGSWKPSCCRHVICTACICRLARESWWEQVMCPYCRTITSLRAGSKTVTAGLRRYTGGWRRRLIMPPIVSELWQQVMLQKREQDHPACLESFTEDDDDDDDDEEEEEEEEEEENENGEVIQWRPWRTLKKLLKGGGGQAHARGGRGRVRGGSGSTWRRQQPINCSGMKDLALVTCYVV